MQRWEYAVVIGQNVTVCTETGATHLSSKSGETDTATLCRLGREGWELVSVTANEDGRTSRLYLKRPLPEVTRA